MKNNHSKTIRRRLSVIWHKLASPRYFETLATRFTPWCNGLSAILLCLGCVWGLFFAPADYQQGDAFRIIYVHVPVAAMSMGIYVSMAISSAFFYIFNIKLGAYYCRSMAPLGATFTVLALATGAIWGKPMWGAYWTWGDARLLSELILLFLYLGYIGLVTSIEQETLADKMGSLLLIIGVINVPIIHYSVVWWNSLHQGATILKFGKPSMDNAMLVPLLINLFGIICYVAGYALTTTRTKIIEHRNRRLDIF